jgi:hypothetical protein
MPQRGAGEGDVLVMPGVAAVASFLAAFASSSEGQLVAGGWQQL